MKRFVPLVAGVVVAAVCVRLAVWQLHRLAARRASNAAITARLDAAPVAVDTVFAHYAPAPGASPVLPLPDSLAFRRATARGTFDFAHQVILELKSWRAIPGVYVVTPLVLPSGVVVLVERGWAPSPDGKTVKLADLTEPDSASVTGILLAPVQTEPLVESADWPRYAREPEPQTMAAALRRPVAGLTLRRLDLPPKAPEAMRAIDPPELSEGPHLSYAIQWFAFAAIALVGSAALTVKGKT